MNAYTVIAQANVASPPTTPKIVKITKPTAGQALDVDLGYGQAAKLDLSGVANEKVSYLHIGEKLVITFDNQSTVTVHPVFDSMGVVRSDLTFDVAGRDLSGSQFSSTVESRIVHIVKPADGQAVKVELGFDQSAKLDLSAIANDKITLVHVGDKSVRVFRYHKETVKSFFEVLAATGYTRPSDLRPWHILRRISASEVRNYSEIYPMVEPGALVDSTVTGTLALAWNAASPDHF